MKSKYDAVAHLEDIRTVSSTDETGDPIEVVMSRMGEIRLEDGEGRTIVSYHVGYGSHLKIKDKQKVKPGDVLTQWDPFNAVILSQFEGKVVFEFIEKGITYKEERDEQTGHVQKIITQSKDKTKNPSIIIETPDGETATSSIPEGAYLNVEEGQHVKAGQILVKIPRSASKNRDITGGLPRVTELFEARNPSNPAVVSEIDGFVSYGGIKRGNREVFVKSKKDGIRKKYMVSLSKHILVQENDFVKAGSPLSDGAITPSDILAIKGPTAVQEYLVNEIQEVYRLQGVGINDKHIEVVVRQMMQKVEIIDQGDTRFLPKQIVDRFDFREANDEILDMYVVTEAGDAPDCRPGMILTARKLRDINSQLRREDKNLVEVREAKAAVAMPTLRGITRASLTTQSFISAASFQETTKVLSEASIAGKRDNLLGLKENVIVGHLIPAGSGQRRFDKLNVYNKDTYEEIVESREAEEAIAKPRGRKKTENA